MSTNLDSGPNPITLTPTPTPTPTQTQTQTQTLTPTPTLTIAQAALGGVRAAMNIFTSALLYSLAPDSGACTAAAVNTQRAVLTGLLFLCSTDAGQAHPLA